MFHKFLLCFKIANKKQVWPNWSVVVFINKRIRQQMVSFPICLTIDAIIGITHFLQLKSCLVTSRCNSANNKLTKIQFLLNSRRRSLKSSAKIGLLRHSAT